MGWDKSLQNQLQFRQWFGVEITIFILFLCNSLKSYSSVAKPSQFKWPLLHSHHLYHSIPNSFSSVQFSCLVVSDSWRPHGLQHARPPCPSPAPRVYSNSCPLSRWYHPTISSSVIPFSSCLLQSFPASGSFQMSQLFTSGGQSIRVSALTSVLPVNTQDWSLGWTGWISLQSKELSRVFTNTTVQKHQFFGAQLSL